MTLASSSPRAVVGEGRLEDAVPEKLRVLLVDQRADRSSSLVAGLEQAGCQVLSRADDCLDFERAVAGTAPDVVIIDLESPDRDTLEGMARLHKGHARPIVMFVDESDSESIRSAVRAGVAAYVVKGADPERIRPVLEVAIARFEQFQALKGELREARASLEQRKVVERAKGLLMERRQLPEQEAYASLRKMAMSRNLRIAEVARRVIEMADLL